MQNLYLISTPFLYSWSPNGSHFEHWFWIFIYICRFSSDKCMFIVLRRNLKRWLTRSEITNTEHNVNIDASLTGVCLTRNPCHLKTHAAFHSLLQYQTTIWWDLRALLLQSFFGCNGSAEWGRSGGQEARRTPFSRPTYALLLSCRFSSIFSLLTTRHAHYNGPPGHPAFAEGRGGKDKPSAFLVCTVRVCLFTTSEH
jgi:hypothetical protein